MMTYTDIRAALGIGANLIGLRCTSACCVAVTTAVSSIVLCRSLLSPHRTTNERSPRLCHGGSHPSAVVVGLRLHTPSSV